MYSMKHLAIITSLVAVMVATPALADSTSKAVIEDHFKSVIEQTPYTVEICREVKVPFGNKQEFDKESAIIGGIIGGVIGNQFGNGGGKEAMTGIGALSGAIIAGSKDKGPEGYRTEMQCKTETRYEEKKRTVYSHSTVRFITEGQAYELKFFKTQ